MWSRDGKAREQQAALQSGLESPNSSRSDHRSSLTERPPNVPGLLAFLGMPEHCERRQAEGALEAAWGKKPSAILTRYERLKLEQSPAWQEMPVGDIAAWMLWG